MWRRRTVLALSLLLNAATAAYFASRKLSVYHSVYSLDRESLFDALDDVPGRIVFLGDSLTDHGEWAELCSDPRVVNRGIGGARVQDVSRRLAASIANEPAAIFLMIGINDLLAGGRPERILDEYAEVIARIRKEAPAATLFVQSILPVNNSLRGQFASNLAIAELNKLLAARAISLDAQFLDLTSWFADGSGQLDITLTRDGIHLNGDGYLRWARALSVPVAQVPQSKAF